MFRSCVSVLLLTGCEPMPQGDGAVAAVEGVGGADGAAGAAGVAGANGVPGGGFRWHDAVGAAVTVSSDLSFFDAEGLRWLIDRETGRAATWPGLAVEYFTSPDCTGRRLTVSSAAPRAPMRDNDGRVLVRPDRLAMVPACLGSFRTSPDNCGASTLCADVMWHSDLEAGPAVPSTSWVGPLHARPL